MEPHPEPDQRLLEVLARYQAAYVPARPGTLAHARLAVARLDLALTLVQLGDQLDETVRVQAVRDAELLMATTQPLEAGQE